MTPGDLDIALRLLAATGLGMAMGLERFLRGKPTGIRTLGLVSFGAALVTLATAHANGVQGSPEALSRVLQGVDQGVLVGIGFLGSGIILRDPAAHKVKNLTTAAEVWVIAALGLATAVAPWSLIGLAYALLVVVIVLFRVLEKRFHLKPGHVPDDEL
jgi:putative Mg2+ transporter-C (MgtC) family protein